MRIQKMYFCSFRVEYLQFGIDFGRRNSNIKHLSCILCKDIHVINCPEPYFASKVRENIPAAMGAAEEVPLNSSVHL